MTISRTKGALKAKSRADSPSERAMFLKGFIKHPAMVASIVPSSGKLIRHMLGEVDWANTKVFVEYGPGVGTFTRPVLDRLMPDAKLISIDTNPDFVRHLRASIRDPRLSVVHGSAADVEKILADHGFDHADYALSGLPFTSLPAGVGDAIGAATYRALKPGGVFLVYQFTRNVFPHIDPFFDSVDHALEWWNVPPSHLYWARKNAA